MTRVNFKNSVIALAIGVATISCGSRNSNAQQQAATPETAQTATQQVAQNADVAKILSLGGLSESDIKPDGFVKFLPFDDEEFVIEASAPLGEEGQKAWVKKIFDKCQQLSTDGKIYRAAYVGDNPSAYEYRDFEQFYSRAADGWAYPCKGKYICVVVGSLASKNSCSFSVSENE